MSRSDDEKAVELAWQSYLDNAGVEQQLTDAGVLWTPGAILTVTQLLYVTFKVAFLSGLRLERAANE